MGSFSFISEASTNLFDKNPNYYFHDGHWNREASNCYYWGEKQKEKLSVVFSNLIPGRREISLDWPICNTGLCKDEICPAKNSPHSADLVSCKLRDNYDGFIIEAFMPEKLYFRHGQTTNGFSLITALTLPTCVQKLTHILSITNNYGTNAVNHILDTLVDVYDVKAATVTAAMCLSDIGR